MFNTTLPNYDFLNGFMGETPCENQVDFLQRENLKKEGQLIVYRQRLELLRKERDSAIEKVERLENEAELDFEGQHGTSVVEIVEEFELGYLLGVAVRLLLKAGDGQDLFDIKLLRRAIIAVEKHIETLEDDC